MKKTIFLAALVCVLASSCKKYHICNCTYTVTEYFENEELDHYSYSAPYTTGKMKKKSAKNKCEASNGTVMQGNMENGEQIETDCKLQ